MPTTGGVIFDLDGTLIDSAVTILEIISEIRLERSAAPVTAADIRPHLSAGGAALVGACLGEVATEADVDLALFRTRYAKVRQGPEILFGHVERVLEEIHALGLPMAICTNKPAILAQNALEHTGLARFFDVVVAGDPAMPCKPDPAPLREACRRLGVAPAHCVLVGDSEADAEAAQAADVTFVFVSYGYPVGNPDLIKRHHQIDCASGLPGVVRRVFERTFNGELV